MSSDHDHSRNRQHAQAISNAITKLQHDHYGRGPDSVRTVVGYDHISASSRTRSYRSNGR